MRSLEVDRTAVHVCTPLRFNAKEIEDVKNQQPTDARNIRNIRYGTASNWSASVAGTGPYYTLRGASNRRHDDGCPGRRCIQAINADRWLVQSRRDRAV